MDVPSRGIKLILVTVITISFKYFDLFFYKT